MRTLLRYDSIIYVYVNMYFANTSYLFHEIVHFINGVHSNIFSVDVFM